MYYYTKKRHKKNLGVQLGLWPSPLVKLDRWMGQNAMSCATRMLEGEEVVEHLQKDALSWKFSYKIYIKDANRKKKKQHKSWAAQSTFDTQVTIYL